MFSKNTNVVEHFMLPYTLFPYVVSGNYGCICINKCKDVLIPLIKFLKQLKL